MPTLPRLTVCLDCCGSGQLSAADPRSSARPCPHCFGRGEVEIPADRYGEEPMSPLGAEVFSMVNAMNAARRRG